MRTGRCAAAILLLLLLSPPVSARKWTDSSGNFSVEAELVDFTGETVRLKKRDGTIIAVPFARLSQADRDFLTGGSGVARRARGVLQQYCHSCHGQDGADEGGMNYVLNLKRLVDAEKVVPEEPGRSTLLQRMLDREMPPEDAERQPTVADIAIIEEWIRSGAPALEAPMDRTFLGNDDIVRYVAADVHAAAERDRPYYRYFTITHLYNGGVSDDELQTFRLALAKLLNSLSWERELVHPKPVDPAETIFRVDIRDMRWSIRHWDLIVARYAYGVRQVSSEANLLYRAVGTPVPWIRADWFVAVASRPPLYHGLLDMPDSLPGLESQLKIDFERNVRQDRAARAGFSDSGISVNPRIIERHKTSDGACWISRDFSGSAGRKNFFNHPLDFEADGGEVIFSLPNGLQAYLLVDAEGKRIDQAPTSIVKDPETTDGAVTNGISCMRCHAGGIIPKDDEVRRSVTANARVFADVLPTINALYPERDQFQEVVDEDRGRFIAALQKLGITRFSSSGEPIHNTSRRFREPLDVRLASAELGLPVDQFEVELERRPSLQRVLGPLRVPNGVVHREAFEEVFGGVVDVLPGVRHHPPTAAIAATTSSAGVASSASQATRKGLLHHWRFDETKGDIARDSAGRNNVLLTGWGKESPRWVEGKIGGALEFSEASSYAVTASPVFKDQVTASFWLRVKYEEGNNPRLIEPWCGLQYEHRKGVGQGSQIADAAKPEPGAWWHYAVAIDFIERTITIYRNGDEVARGSLVIGRHTGTLVFGHNRDPGNPRDTLRGQLDDIRVYGRILTPEEIAQLAGAE